MNLYLVLDKTVGIGFMVVAEDWADVPDLVDALEVPWFEDSALTAMVAADVMEEPQVLTAFRIRGTDQKPPVEGSDSQCRSPEARKARNAKRNAKRRAREMAET